MARPKSQEGARRDSVQTWVTTDELEIIRKAAKKQEKSMAGFVREHLLKVADEINQGRVEPSYQ